MSERVEILTEDQAVKGYDYPIEVKVYEGGTQLVPSSATVTVKNPNGEKQVEDQAMIVDDYGTLTYTLLAAKTVELWENALIEIEYTLDTVKNRTVFFFDVVLNKLKCSVTDEDLKKYHPEIALEIWDEEANYSDQISEAFKVVKRDIKDKGRRPAMLIDGMQIRELVILKTFELLFFDFAKEEDKWWIRYQETKERYQDRFSKLNIVYDKDESGKIEASEKEGALGQITLER